MRCQEGSGLIENEVAEVSFVIRFRCGNGGAPIMTTIELEDITRVQDRGSFEIVSTQRG